MSAPDCFDDAFLSVWDEAVEQVATLWPVIERVGRRLAVRGKLSAEELEAVCVDHSKWHLWTRGLATKRRIPATSFAEHLGV